MHHRPIREVVQRNGPMLTAPQTISVLDAAHLMKESKRSAVLVVDGSRLVGIFTERDALFRVLAAERDPKTTPLSAVMTPHPTTVHPSKPFGHALHLMFEGGFRHIPVVDGDRLVGLISTSDALGPELGEFASELEEREHIGQIL